MNRRDALERACFSSHARLSLYDHATFASASSARLKNCREHHWRTELLHNQRSQPCSVEPHGNATRLDAILVIYILTDAGNLKVRKVLAGCRACHYPPQARTPGAMSCRILRTAARGTPIAYAKSLEACARMSDEATVLVLETNGLHTRGLCACKNLA